MDFYPPPNPNTLSWQSCTTELTTPCGSRIPCWGKEGDTKWFTQLSKQPIPPTQFRSNRNRLTLEAKIRVMVIHRSIWIDGQENEEMKHRYNQKHTVTTKFTQLQSLSSIQGTTPTTRLSQTNKSSALTCMESTNQHSPGDSINKPNRTGTTPVKYNATDWVRGGCGMPTKLNPDIKSPRKMVFSSTQRSWAQALLCCAFLR